MNVLQLRSGGGLYGAENVILGLSSGLRDAGHSVTVLNLQESGREGPGLVEAARALGLESREVACESRLDLAAIRDVAGCLRGRRVDLVHSHDYKSDVYAYLCARAAKVKLVATCHNWASDKPLMSLYKSLDKLVMRRFARVAAVSEPLRRELTSSGIDGARVVNIPNGVALGARIPAERVLALRKSLGLGDDEKVVLSVGRLSAEKGHARLLAAAREAAASRPRVRFLLAGDGPLRAELETAASAGALGGRVLFLGERRDVRELLALSDVFVLPSFKEGLPLALLEAMAARTPVVAAPVGEIPVVVAHGVSGLLIDPADAGALARAVLRLLDAPVEAAALAEEGYKRVRDDYSVAAMVRRYVDFYRGALAS